MPWRPGVVVPRRRAGINGPLRQVSSDEGEFRGNSVTIPTRWGEAWHWLGRYLSLVPFTGRWLLDWYRCLLQDGSGTLHRVSVQFWRFPVVNFWGLLWPFLLQSLTSDAVGTCEGVCRIRGWTHCRRLSYPWEDNLSAFVIFVDGQQSSAAVLYRNHTTHARSEVKLIF